jgi:hypothetical protein
MDAVFCLSDSGCPRGDRPVPFNAAGGSYHTCQMDQSANQEDYLIPEYHYELIDNLNSFGFALISCIFLVFQLGFELSNFANLPAPVHFSAQIMLPAIAGFMIFSMVQVFFLANSFCNPPES